jgi:4a-hydroxytetrahydrobiopterin dehydratase
MSSLAALALDTNRKAAVPLGAEEILELKKLLADWDIRYAEQQPQLCREFRFRNFAEALLFTNRIGELAEAADHHPALLTEWGKVTVSWWTHSIRGLHLNDFIMAARCDEVCAALAT